MLTTLLRYAEETTPTIRTDGPTKMKTGSIVLQISATYFLCRHLSGLWMPAAVGRRITSSAGLRQVEVLVGKDKGRQGTVSQVIEERNWVVVERLNAYYRLVGKTAAFPGTMIASEAPLLVDDQVALLDPADK